MAKKSIGQLHATVTANAAQFVDEFKRADNAARRHGESIRKQVEHVVKDIEKDFSLKKLSKGLMAGVGIGGGLELARSAMEKLGEVIAAPTERAKELSEYIAEIRKDLNAIHDSRFEFSIDGMAPGRKAAAISDEMDAQRRKLADVEAARERARADMVRAGSGDFQAGSMEGRALKDKYHLGVFGNRSDIQDAAQKEIDRQQTIADELEKKIQGLAGKELNAVEELNRAVDKALDGFFKSLDEAAEKASKDLDSRTKHMRDALASPLDKYNSGLDELRALREAGRISFDDVERGKKSLLRRLNKDSEPDMGRWEKAAGKVQVDEMTKRGMGSGANYAEITRQNTNILAEIRDLLMRATAGGYGRANQYSD